MNFNLLSLLLLAWRVSCFEDCSHGLSPAQNDVIKLHNLEAVERGSHHLEVSFQGIALYDTKELLASVGISVLGIRIKEETFSYCHDSRDYGKKTWLRVSSDEVPDCSFRQGEAISGSFVIGVSEPLLQGMNFNYRLKLSDGRKETCAMEEKLLLRSFKTSPSGQRFSFSQEEIDTLWKYWTYQHQNKLYLPPVLTEAAGSNRNSHLAERRHIFEANLLKIAMHNANGKNSYKMAMNHFGHLTPMEFKRYYASGLNSALSSKTVSKQLKRDPYKQLPVEVNWVREGAVTPVKNQGVCGSCWSFAATGALEGAYFLSTGTLVSFSEQELVSCDHVDLGCQGGAMDNAWQFAQNNGGLCTEGAFPYTSGEAAVRGFCNTSCSPVAGSSPDNIVDVFQDEASLEEAVAQQPVAVAIEADEESFQFYSSGVLTAECSNRLDHGVLAVGYGSDPEQQLDYWLVKNSWGDMWGLNGYVKIERGLNPDVGGECGILLGASYPEL